MNQKRARAEALFAEAGRQLAAGRDQEAEKSLRAALELAPELAEAHANLALLLERRGQPAEAEQHYRQSLALNPDIGRTHLNLGALLTTQKRFDEAESAYCRALELMPDSAGAWSNLGVLLACCKRETEAEECYRTALTLEPDYRRARFNLSYLLLRQGRYDEGWAALEARNWHDRLEQQLPCPRWHGEPLTGRSILIGFEAGYGDMIQFCRFATLLKERGAARVSLVCHPQLQTLFTTLDGLDEVYPFDSTAEPVAWDFWTPPFSIPYHCRTRLDTIPARLPYLHPDPAQAAKWGAELAGDCPPGALRVGLVWKGSTRFENDDERSLPGLATLATLWEVQGVRFYSLQKGAGEAEAAAPPAGQPLIHLGPRLRDFADTAALVANLDLVISVDTAVAHLAGALGRNVWLLLPDFKTDWRWLTDRSDSPWYPGVMRLFRQPSRGDWRSVVAAVRRALQQRVDRNLGR